MPSPPDAAKLPRTRKLAHDLLRDWESGSAFAADLLEAASSRARLSPPDRAFLQDLVYTTIRNYHLLEEVRAQLAGAKSDPKTRRLLCQGLAEVLFLHSAPHALVNETVKLAGRARSVVNAVLRRALRETPTLRDWIENLEPSRRWSVPPFLWNRWCRDHGEANAAFFAAWNHRPAPVYLRINTLHPSAAAVSNHPGLEPAPPFSEEFRLLRAGHPLPKDLLASGACYAQDPSTTAAIDLLHLEPALTILDACAAPGGKTLAIALRNTPSSSLFACDSSPPRVERLRQNLARLHVPAEIACIDWLNPENPFTPGLPETFDRILVDVPCSNTGVTRRRIDVPHRLRPEEFETLAATQRALLDRLAPRLAPGGILVYSTCSLDSEENESVVEAFLQAHPGFRLEATRSVLPWRDGFDGAFAAALRHSHRA